jgi:hypothetical protein
MEKWAKELGINDKVRSLLTEKKLPNLET